MIRTRCCIFSELALFLLLASQLCAAETDFESKIAPIFKQHCLSCHNPIARKGGLSLDSKTNFEKGGENGKIVSTNDSSASLLISLLRPVARKAEMPKDAPPLSSEHISLIEKWIAAGAKWPDDLVLETDSNRVREWWSLSQLERPAIPSSAAMASDLSGELIALPSHELNRLDTFVAAKLSEVGLVFSVAANRQTLVRRVYFDLIGLPPTPEEIDGFVADNREDAYQRLVDRLLSSPRYGERWARHWLDVVHYGDTHGYDKDKPRPNAWPYRDYVVRSFNQDKPWSAFVQEQVAGDALFPETVDGIEALGFIAAGPWDFVGHAEVPETKIDGKIARHLDRDDMVRTTVQSFCSLTVGCAQCHHHKFDPISQEDYYRLHAVFSALDRADKQVGDDPKRLVYAGTVYKGSGAFQGTGANQGKPRPIFVLDRGDVTKPKDEVAPGALSVLDELSHHFNLPPEQSEGDRRAALAKWLADRDNCLTWRSIVNRVWQYHFGRGLVDTTNDFGRMGALPTHPELLDWLAVEFRDSGQSLKSLHRQIVTSYTYCQESVEVDSDASRRALAIDSGNRWLWRMNSRKLEAEAVRDSVLYVAGKLDLKMGGPAFQDFVIEKPEHSPHYEYRLHDPEDPGAMRRSIYRFIVRSQLQPFMTTLDCADPSMQVDRRNESVTPLQALAMLNNGIIVVMARHFSEKLERQGGTLEQQVERGFREVTGRSASRAELEELAQFATEHGLDNCCRVMLNLSEFSFVD